MPTKTHPITVPYLSNPPVSENFGLGASRMVEDRNALIEVVAEEHELDPTQPSVEHGRHLPGSAVSYIQETAPTLRPNGLDALTRDDVGRLWVKPNDADPDTGWELYIYAMTVDAVNDEDDEFDWVCIFRFNERVDQDLRTTASPEFASIEAALATIGALSVTTFSGTVDVARRIRTSVVSTPSPGDIWIE